jgi:prophage DNA circulation protein
MMEWLDQSKQLLESWAEAQRKAWDQWSDALKTMAPSAPADAWADILDRWQKSVTDTLNAQSDLTRTLMENLGKISGSPDWLGDSARKAEELTQQMTATQQKIWDGWFEALKKADPSNFSGSWEEARKYLDAWQASASKAMDDLTTQAAQWSETQESNDD